MIFNGLLIGLGVVRILFCIHRAVLGQGVLLPCRWTRSCFVSSPLFDLILSIHTTNLGDVLIMFYQSCQAQNVLGVVQVEACLPVRSLLARIPRDL